ncbi:MAG: metallophosphoesterase, partial [Candidatus Fermentibacteria bacterium]
MASKDYDESVISAALDEVLASTRQRELKHTFDVSSGRYIFISDIHKGVRDCADDFRASEKAYNAMLAYYNSLGHTLVILGDAEELWKSHPGPVLKKYRHSYHLESKYFQDDRYIRIWGNHDITWRNRRNLRKHLQRVLNEGFISIIGKKALHVPEACLIEVTDGDSRLGEIFLVHGHQGSVRSDKRLKWSKLIVFIFARPIQCFFRNSWNPKTPSHDSALRKDNNKALYSWSKKQDDLILIAGHTHRPVFASESHLARVERDLKELKPSSEGYVKKKAVLEAEREWAITQELQMPDDMTEEPMEKKCYFNAGCCCYTDGDTTAIEICDGQIRLVHWPDKQGNPKPHILQ